jgi:hypothetical protein
VDTPLSDTAPFYFNSSVSAVRTAANAYDAMRALVRINGDMSMTVASYVRRYLQASVEHEIRALSAEVLAVRAQLDVALQQNERLAATLARLSSSSSRHCAAAHTSAAGPAAPGPGQKPGGARRR